MPLAETEADLGEFAQFVRSPSDPQLSVPAPEDDLGDFAQFVQGPAPTTQAVVSGSAPAEEPDLGPFAQFVQSTTAPETESAVKASPNALEIGWNAVKAAGAEVGESIFKTAQGLYQMQAEVMANPTPEMTDLTGDQLFKSFQDQAAIKVEDEATRARVREEALASAAYWKERSYNARAESFVDPSLDDHPVTKVARGLAKGGMMAAEAAIPIVGLPLMATQGMFEVYSDALNAGQTNEEAETNAVKSLIGLAIFGGANKAVAGGLSKMLGQDAGRLKTFITQFVGQTAGNEATGLALAAYDAAEQAEPGKRLAAATEVLKVKEGSDLETFAMSVGFGALGAAHAMKGRAGTQGRPATDPAKTEVPPTEPRTESGIAPESPGIVTPQSPDRPSSEPIRGPEVMQTEGQPVEKTYKVYHATRGEPFEAFDPARIGQNEAHQTGDGFYFDTQKTSVEGYARESGSILGGEVTLKNPAPKEVVKKWISKVRDFDTRGMDREQWKAEIRRRAAEMRNSLMAEGYDGYFPVGTHASDGNYYGEIVVFRPEQFKLTEINGKAVEPDVPFGFGPGAAAAGEFGPKATTSTKNAVVDAERAERGLSPVMSEARKSNPTLWDEAETILDAKPETGTRMVDEILQGKKKQGSDVDEAILLREKIRVQNERTMARDRALDEGLPPEERAYWQDEYARHETRMGQIDEATRMSGTAAGRFLQARKLIAADDFTLAEMEAKARMAKGSDLTPEEAATIKKQSEQLERTEREAAEKIGQAEEGAAVDAAEQEVRKLKVKATNVVKVNRKRGIVEDIEGQREAIVKGMRDRIADGDKPADMRSWIQKLAENLLRADPALERDPLLDRLHTEVSKVTDLSRRQVMDLLSGYGDMKLLNPDATKAKLRGIKGELQQVAKIEDMLNRQAPKKTGVERRTPTDEERRLIKQVNELKKKGGFEITDPAKQLKSALDAVKTRLRNQIADLEHQVATQVKIVRTKSDLPYDAEATQLKSQRDALKTQFDEIFGKPEMTEAQRIKVATAAVERGIADYERRIQQSDFSRKTSKLPESAELQSLRSRRDALRDEYKLLEAAAHPERGLEASLRVYKANLRRQSAQLEDRMARNDFEPRKPKAKPELDPEALELKFEHAKTKEAYLRKNLEWMLANRTLPKWMLDTGRETLNTTRALLTSLDLSAVLRQGGFIAIAHPIRAAKAMPDMFRAMASERGQHKVEAEIRSRDNAKNGLYENSKLYLADDNAISLTAMEEAFMSRWIGKIPTALGGGLVRGSARAYVTFLNRVRADSFDVMAKTLSRDGQALTPEQGKAIANFINVATGRGDLGVTAQKAAVGLNTAFFAPRYVLSRFQLLSMQPLRKGGDAKSKKLIATEYGRYLIGMGTVYALAQAMGGDLEADPRSSDFGKIKIGNTRLDPLSGLAQTAVISSRLATGQTKKGSGEIVDLRGENVPYKGDTGGDVLGRFLRSKLSPAFSTGWDLAAGENVIGEPVTPASAALRMVTPLAIGDIKQTMVEQGVPEGTALGLLSIFGMGLQTFDRDKKNGATDDELAAPVGIGLPGF